MRKYVFALALLGGACGKKAEEVKPTTMADPAAAKPTAADPKHGDMTPGPNLSDPKNLPAAGVAPPAHTADKELIPMWNAEIKTLKGQPTNLDAYKGKALLLVNVASQCGNTPQYASLEALQKKYGPKGFTVIGFPCNQFGEQEPGSAEEIQKFCSVTYGVTFPLMEKIEVNGANRHEIYKTLVDIPDPMGKKGDIEWNFEKFVISADGKQITRFSNRTKPDDPGLIAAVENALPKT